MSQELLEHPYAKTIWALLCHYFGNEYGVAALMGNLQAESGLYPNRVQGDVPYSSYSIEYTADVDSGAISKDDFVYNGPNGGGYGLAQWTDSRRKERLYDAWKAENYDSIGSVELACWLLHIELRDYFPNTYVKITDATNIREASDAVLHDFENPADQSESVEVLRAQMGAEIYNTFKGTGGGSGGDPIHNPKHNLSKLLLYAIATDDY